MLNIIETLFESKNSIKQISRSRHLISTDNIRESYKLGNIFVKIKFCANENILFCSVSKIYKELHISFDEYFKRR